MQCVTIIQARRQSTRLPDKVLMPIAGVSILAHVIKRCKLIEGIDQVVCAIPNDSYNDVLADIAIEAGAAIFRGSEHDVLDRYYQAAATYKADVVMRVTADCPLLDPYVCAEAVSLVQTGFADYSATAGEWPHGMDCEVFSFKWLEKAHKSAKLPEDREHVTLWMKGHTAIRRKTIDPEIKGLRSSNRWVVDYPEDYDFLTQLAAHVPNGELPLRWQDTVGLLDAHTSLRDINRHCNGLWETANQKIYKLAREHR